MAVVGGGFVGLAAAWWLARAGRRPMVLEAEGLAGRASGRNAGFLLTGSGVPLARRPPGPARERELALWHRSRENRDLLRAELLAPGRADCEVLAEGSWIAALGDGDGGGGGGAAELEESAELLRQEGFDLEWRDARAARAAAGSPRLAGAIHQPGDLGLDPVRLCRELARLGGFEVRTGFRVRGIESAGDRIRLASDAGEVIAERVVLALNAYAPALVPHLAAAVRPVRGQMLATEPGPRSLAGVWFIDDGFEYLRQLADGTVLVGGGRQVAREEEVGYLESPTATVQGALEGFLRSTFPAFSGRRVRHRWAGTMAFTDDALPRLGVVPHRPGASYAAGFSGHGLSLGFVAGRWLARHAAGEEPPPLFPSPTAERVVGNAG